MSTAEAQGALWGERAEHWAEQEDRQVALYEEAIRRTRIRPATAVLDVGCGSGAFLQAAAARGAQLSGLDASEALLEIARARVPDADLRRGDMMELPFADDAFDVVTGFNSFQFARDIAVALREAARVARPGARVLIQVWGRPENCDLGAMQRAVAPLRPARGAIGPPPTYWEPGVLELLAAGAGLTPESTFDFVSAFEYADDTTMVSRMLSAGAMVDAIHASGEEAVAGAIRDALAPFRSPAGAYRLENEWHALIALA